MTEVRKCILQSVSCGLTAGLVLLVGARTLLPLKVRAQSPPTGVTQTEQLDIVKGDEVVWSLDGYGLSFFVDGKQFIRINRGGIAISKNGQTLMASEDVLSVFGLNESGVMLGNFGHSIPGLSIHDSDGKMRIWLALETDGSSALTLYDDNDRARAVLGAVDLEGTKTGRSERRMESSIVLFDKNGKVIWMSPRAICGGPRCRA